MRSWEALIPLIKLHVLPGSKIFSEGFKIYFTLGDKLYDNFVVEHTHTKSRTYIVILNRGEGTKL